MMVLFCILNFTAIEFSVCDMDTHLLPLLYLA